MVFTKPGVSKNIYTKYSIYVTYRYYDSKQAQNWWERKSKDDVVFIFSVFFKVVNLLWFYFRDNEWCKIESKPRGRGRGV